MELVKTLNIHKSELEEINDILHNEPKSSKECFGEDKKIVNTIKFDNGIEMDIEVCGVQYNEAETSNLPWTQAVLFKDGIEVSCTEPSSQYSGEWICEYSGNQYIVTIE